MVDQAVVAVASVDVSRISLPHCLHLSNFSVSFFLSKDSSDAVSATVDRMIVEATVSAILDHLHSVISDRAVAARWRDQKHHASIAERPTVRMVIVRVMTINVHEPILLVLHTFVSNPCSSHCFY